jgi:hypothetical protein
MRGLLPLPLWHLVGWGAPVRLASLRGHNRETVGLSSRIQLESKDR